MSSGLKAIKFQRTHFLSEGATLRLGSMIVGSLAKLVKILLGQRTGQTAQWAAGTVLHNKDLQTPEITEASKNDHKSVLWKMLLT